MFQSLISESHAEMNLSEMLGRVSKCSHAMSRVLVNNI